MQNTVQTNVNSTQNHENWADDVDWSFTQQNNHDSIQQQNSQPNEEIVLVGQDATPKKNTNTQASIGGVPIDVSLPFNRN